MRRTSVMGSGSSTPRLTSAACALIMRSGGSTPRIIGAAGASIIRAAAQAPTTNGTGARLASSRPRSLPLLHANHHRDLGLRSHPPHFASTASMPTHPPPQSIKVRRLAPTTHRSFSLLLRSAVSQRMIGRLDVSSNVLDTPAH